VEFETCQRAMYGIGPILDCRVGQLKRAKPGEETFKGDEYLGPREWCTEAVVNPLPNAKWLFAFALPGRNSSGPSNWRSSWLAAPQRRGLGRSSC
jgi:hypothetical protein